MTKFNPENKVNLTIGEIAEPAMKITKLEDAKQYLDDYIRYICMVNKNVDLNESTKIAKSNLAYYAGYYDNKTRERVEKLFNCSHPIFGSISKNGTPTSKQAFDMGRQFSENNKKKKLRKLRIQKLDKLNNI